ncbi:unnamed protein product [Rotaria sp. Silwood1]|nr:unnamed protein product [Rotaria sp. Silwood1]CAF3558840.1 unnamed protein product [Rotaria sp. Silwood1]CAF3603580.1 unnamed protein product [Rotaria sp. Silwood1]CAF3614291.1 unnamed protein product [Rotaria sp. Silwood1]CAF3615995.1 unnamed protein product [Rotaria sp. Silwood1]
MSSTLFSTSLNSTIITSTTITSETINTYDYEGAAIYVAVILIWYSTGLALMLFLQVRPRTFQSQFLLDYQTNDKSISFSANPFGNYHNIEADTAKKRILNELKDPERRQRLWKIYYSSEEKQNEPHPRYYETITADNVTIGRINRKLADIHRTDARNRDDSILTLLDASSNVNRFDGTKFRTKRISSLRGTSGIPTNNRELSVSIQPQSTDTQIIIPNTEVKSITYEKQSTLPLTNGSRKRTDKFSNRFHVEKVSENSSDSSTVKENTSQ